MEYVILDKKTLEIRETKYLGYEPEGVAEVDGQKCVLPIEDAIKPEYDPYNEQLVLSSIDIQQDKAVRYWSIIPLDRPVAEVVEEKINSLVELANELNADAAGYIDAAKKAEILQRLSDVVNKL